MLEVFWDWSGEGNVTHLAEGDVSPEEFEQVLGRGFEERVPSRSRPDRFVAADYTDAGRYLVIVFELEWIEDLGAWGVTPVTAYPPESPPESPPTKEP